MRLRPRRMACYPDVVCAEAFFEDDRPGVTLQKLPETCFQALPGSDNAGAGQFGSRQVEQVIDVPVQLVSLTTVPWH